MKVLVTGSHGFLGKTLVPMLEEKYGANQVVCPDIDELDMRDERAVSGFMSNGKFDIVVHLAAKMSGIGMLLAQPLEYLEDNLEINHNMVKYSIKNKVGRFITLGSSCGYNDNTPLPMKESSFWKLKPENTYGLCKLVMLEHLQSQKGMEWVYLVPSNLYGPHDHFGDVNAHLIPATILKFEKAAKNGGFFIDVWGDGSQIRDFLYVEDAARLILDSIDIRGFYNKAVNLSTNVGISVKEIVLSIKKALALEQIEIRWDTTKPTGIHKKVLSNEVLTSIIGDFSYTSLNEGLKKTVLWHIQTNNN